METNKENYLTKLFVNEAKPAMKRHSGGGGAGGASGENKLNKFIATRNGDYLFYKSKITSDELASVVTHEDFTGVTSLISAFESCTEITSMPLIDTSAVTNMSRAFYGCDALATIPLIDTSAVTNMSHAFFGCDALTTIPLIDTSAVTRWAYMFSECTSLVSVPGLNMISAQASYMSNMFNNCSAIEGIWLKNIPCSLVVGYASLFGHLLTVESLIHLIYECGYFRSGTTQTLTIGSANLEKISSVYVKLVEITDEMRAEDEWVDKKYPFVVCDSTDEGAVLITDYLLTKKWKLA